MMSNHHVKLAGQLHKFGRTMSDDQLLFPAVKYVYTRTLFTKLVLVPEELVFVVSDTRGQKLQL